MSRESVRRAIRTFIISTLAVFLPGLLGWLHALTEWAAGAGTTPFPDAKGLMFLGVSAIVGGVIALVNLLWNLVEDATGKGLLRNVPPVSHSDQRGVAETRTLALFAAVGVVIILVILIL